MPSISRRRRRLTIGVAALMVLAGAGIYLAVRQVAPLVLSGPGCVARSDGTAFPLDTQQASIASTIAGVARRRQMPAYAVQVAYAAAMQESKLHNLHYGDRDSVGVFQQRPSQGWGPARRLLNPVYASTRFFEVLATVPGYAHMPVYQAAQAVQRSADGYAYMQYQQFAAHLATAFTGHSAHAVWCWAASAAPGKAKLAAARRALITTFGPVDPPHTAALGGAPALVARAPRPALGWAMAAWLVTHAVEYRLHEVRYGGYLWRASAGQAGWTQDRHGARANLVTAS